MNLKSINDSALIEKTESLVRQERELLMAVLHHLREIDRRRLFSALGFKSLFEFTVKRLGYPEDQAYRRISAMKLLKYVPEIEEKIQQGAISLTHIGLVQSLIKQEKKIQQKEMSHSQKVAIFDQISNKSVREAERITLSFSSAPEIAKPDRIQLISENRIEMKFSASNQLHGKIEKLKGWLAHSHPNLSLGELFEKLCDLGLHEWDPSKTAASRKRRVNFDQLKSSKRSSMVESNKRFSDLERKKSSDLQSANRERSSYAQIRRETFKRAQNQCEKCGSEYALEIDHIQPQALGGASTAENLRLLCRSCNQRAAIRAFGIRKMDSYLNTNSN